MAHCRCIAAQASHLSTHRPNAAHLPLHSGRRPCSFFRQAPNVQLFRIGAFVVWNGQVVPIMNRWVHREGATYCLHSKPPGKGLVVEV